MDVDIYDYAWKDRQSGRLIEVIDLEEYEIKSESAEDFDTLILMWYKDIGTGEIHCMSENMFTLKHDICGSMVPSDAQNIT